MACQTQNAKSEFSQISFRLVANCLICSTLSAMTESILPPEPNTETPFAGRETLYARLQQHVLDPPNPHAIIFTGHDGIGKSTLLYQFPRVFDNQILGIYINLATAPLNSVSGWLQYLLEQTNKVLAAHEFSLSRVPQEADEDMDFVDWFRDVYLYRVIHIIRPHRRIVWLLDDVEYLLDALPEQVDYLHQLLQTHLQLAVVMTLNSKYEQRLAELTPLVNPLVAERLQQLLKADSIEVIRQYAPGASDEIINTVYEATGGHPRLLTNFGRELHTAWASHSDNQALQVARQAAYATGDAHFRHMWQLISRDERLILIAMASLIYDDPLAIITPQHIEAWLVETDYPMDIVAIHAALRGLEYQEIISHSRNNGVKLSAGMMQTWLLEHAHLTDIDDSPQAGFNIEMSRPILVVLVVVIALIIALLFMLPSPQLDKSGTIPTVTLSQ